MEDNSIRPTVHENQVAFSKAMQVVDHLNMKINALLRRYHLKRETINSSCLYALHMRLSTMESVRELYLEYARSKTIQESSASSRPTYNRTTRPRKSDNSENNNRVKVQTEKTWSQDETSSYLGNALPYLDISKGGSLSSDQLSGYNPEEISHVTTECADLKNLASKASSHTQTSMCSPVQDTQFNDKDSVKITSYEQSLTVCDYLSPEVIPVSCAAEIDLLNVSVDEAETTDVTLDYLSEEESDIFASKAMETLCRQ